MKTLGLIAALSFACAAQAGILVDFRPASTQTTGYTVGNSFFQWQIYQSFTVNNSNGWHLDRISLSGFLSGGVASGDVLLEIATDTTSAALASSVLTITNTSAGTLAYVGTNFNLDLAGNTSYVLRLKAASTNPFTDVGIHYGVGSPNATSKAASGFTRAQNTPIAAYFEGSVIPTPGTIALLALGSLVATRRRR